MKKRTSIAILIACVMVMTLIPGTAFAETAGTKNIAKPQTVHKKSEGNQKHQKDQLKARLSGYMDDYVQWTLEELEFVYAECIDKESSYIPAIWTEIQRAYEDGRVKILAAKTYDEIDISYEKASAYLSNLGALTKDTVSKASDLSKVKTSYKSALDRYYNSLKKRKSLFSTYYWGIIEDTWYMGKVKVNASKTFGDVTWEYTMAVVTLELMIWTKSGIASLQKDSTLELTKYINLGLEAKAYDSATWTRIKSIQSKANAAIKGNVSAEGIMQAYESAEEELVAITGIEFRSLTDFEEYYYEDEYDYEDDEDYYDEEDEYDLEDEFDFYYEVYDGGWFYPYIMDQMIKLETAFNAYDRNQYSSSGYAKLVAAYMKAFVTLGDASSRAGVDKAYTDGVKKMRAVYTKKKEIAVFKVQKPKSLKVTKKKSSYVKLKWKAVSNAKGYYIYKKVKGGKYKKVGKTTKRTFTAKKLKGNKTYYFKVRAFNNKIDPGKVYYSKYSKTVKAKTLRRR